MQFILQIVRKLKKEKNLIYNYIYKRSKGHTIENKDIKVNGKIEITYKLLCKNDCNEEISLSKLFQNEKVAKVIKSEFAKGFRNIQLLSSNETDCKLKIETIKEYYKFEVSKDDFADILALTEENAAERKLFKKDCNRVELVNIETVS